MGLKLNTASSGSVTLEPANTASNYTLTVPAQTGTIAVNGPAFLAYRTTDVTIPSGVGTKIIFTTKEFDTNTFYNTSTGRFTPTVAGYYYFSSSAGWNTPPVNSYDLYIAKNGSMSTPDIRWQQAISTQNPIWQGSYMFYLNGTTDYVEIYWYQGTGSNQTILGAADRTWFSGYLVRAA